MNDERLKLAFKDIFNHEEGQFFFSPGRINLIGEHTDYNGGHVFPCAITLGTYGLVRKREDKLIRLYSMNFASKGIVEFDLNSLDYKKEHDWANYPKGMLRYLADAGYPALQGLDILIEGNIPNGAGLSSSASIELLIGVMIQDLFHYEMNRIAMVKIAKRVENEFIKVNSGIMDQFVIGMAKKDSALLLDCDSLDYSYAPINLGAYKILIMNTNKRRELADSKYNQRRSECEQALARLQKVKNIDALCELDQEEFLNCRYVIGNDKLEKRAKHAVYENQRTLQAYEKLQSGDLKGFGQLMNASHVSLRDDYEVTGTELDTLVETAWKQEGVLGARMTGAGFGGCAIAIAEESAIEQITETIGEVYEEKIGYAPSFYIAQIGSEASQLVKV